jgi:hypothetical protein
MKKTQTKIQDPYTLRMRTFTQVGEPNAWTELGTGEFTDIETIQRYIRARKATYPNRTIEIEFIYQGQLRNYKGEVTGKNILLKRRD